MKKKGIYENACFQALVIGLPVYRAGIPSSPINGVAVNL